MVGRVYSQLPLLGPRLPSRLHHPINQQTGPLLPLPALPRGGPLTRRWHRDRIVRPARHGRVPIRRLALGQRRRCRGFGIGDGGRGDGGRGGGFGVLLLGLDYLGGGGGGLELGELGGGELELDDEGFAGGGGVLGPRTAEGRGGGGLVRAGHGGLLSRLLVDWEANREGAFLCTLVWR
jgi:hypothetical protein